MKKIFKFLVSKLPYTLIGMALMVAGVVYAAPSFNYVRSEVPETDSIYESGTTTKAWLKVHSDQFCLTGDSCIATWPTGGGGSGSITTSTPAQAGKVAAWTGLATLGNGSLFDNGTVAGQNATSATVSFNLQGTAGLTPFVVASSTGTALMTVTQAGNVGIGTTTPGSRLLIQGSAGSTTDLFTISSSTGNSLLTVTSAGKVGINSSTPSSLFTVDSQTSNATTTIQLDSLGTKGTCLKLKDSDGTGYTYLSVLNGALLTSATSCE